MRTIKYPPYTIRICTDIEEWAEEHYGMPENGILDNKEALDKECMGFAQIDSKQISIFIPKKCNITEIEDVVAHEVWHIIEGEYKKKPSQEPENDHLHKEKAKHYESFFKTVREISSVIAVEVDFNQRIFNNSILGFVNQWFNFDGEKYYPKPKPGSPYIDNIKVREFKKQDRYTPEQIVELYLKSNNDQTS